MTEILKPKILIVTNHFSPGFKAGGPIRSVGALIKNLSGDFRFDVLTTDRDLGDSLPYKNIVADTWQTIPDQENVRIFYSSPRFLRRLNISQFVEEVAPDIVYVNSFFSKLARKILFSSSRIRAGRPIIFAPRGELMISSIVIKAWKKKPFIFICKATGIHKRVLFHGTSEQERQELSEVFPGARITLAPNLGHQREPTVRQLRKSTNPLRVVSVGRISSKKNIVLAINALAKVTVPVQFDIIGPLEDMNYLALCKAAADLLPKNIECRFLGPIPHQDMFATLSKYDVLLHPTLGENFGHTILEAMQAGLLPIVTDQTFWNFIEEQQAGLVLPCTIDAFTNAIERIDRMTPNELLAWQQRAMGIGVKYATSPESIEAHRQMFMSACS